MVGRESGSRKWGGADKMGRIVEERSLGAQKILIWVGGGVRKGGNGEGAEGEGERWMEAEEEEVGGSGEGWHREL